MSEFQHICIAPESSRRAQFWKETLAIRQEELIFLPYLAIISGDFTLDKSQKYLIRIESPGEDFLTYKTILLLGCDSYQEKQEIQTLQEDFGKLSNFKLWRKGWTKMLKKISDLEQVYQVRFINHPKAINQVFDKGNLQSSLTKLGVNCPLQLKKSQNYAELVAEMKTQSLSQVFLKPIAGSSASGIMAFKFHSEEKQILYTTLLKKGNTYYNSLKLITYRTPEEIKAVINHLFQQELIVEKWLPKWRYNGQNIDFRVVVIGGKAEFLLPRGSKHMITNLHLGNNKLTVESSGISSIQLQKIKQLAEKAMAYFPSLFYAGVDILLDRAGKKAFVLEINAFGDLLLNLKNKEEKTVYDLEYDKLISD